MGSWTVMELICDFCKEEDENLVWDDIHKSFSPSVMYMFLCEKCAKINDGFWQLDTVKMHADMEMSMMLRTFNRYRKEIKNV